MISPEALHTELTKVEDALKKILGIKPKFFRPPYGSYNTAALEVLHSRGYHSESAQTCRAHVCLVPRLTDTRLCSTLVTSSHHVVNGLG